MNILIILFNIAILGVMLYCCYISSAMLSERSALRELTGAYYDFEINERLQEMKRDVNLKAKG